jgi:hypothetical protein
MEPMPHVEQMKTELKATFDRVAQLRQWEDKGITHMAQERQDYMTREMAWGNFLVGAIGALSDPPASNVPAKVSKLKR